jgi:DNA repair exonuclease SbcCD nuclease subunit
MVVGTRGLRILHLSDLHAKAEEDEDYFGKKRVVESLLRDLREQIAEKSVDLIVFSGDLAFDGTQAALEAGRSMLLEPIRNMFADATFVLLPGNHDVDREQIEDVEELGLQAALDSREATNMQQTLSSRKPRRAPRSALPARRPTRTSAIPTATPSST